MFTKINNLKQENLAEILKLVEQENIWSSVSWQIALSNNQVYGLYLADIQTQLLEKAQAPVEFSQEQAPVEFFSSDFSLQSQKPNKHKQLSKNPVALSELNLTKAPVDFAKELAGCLVLNFIEDVSEIEQIFVVDFLRNLGIGGLLLDFAINISRQQEREQIWLEVRESNTSAISLYKSKGFIQTGIRKNYYKSNQTNSSQTHENALLFSLSLN